MGLNVFLYRDLILAKKSENRVEIMKVIFSLQTEVRVWSPRLGCSFGMCTFGACGIQLLSYFKAAVEFDYHRWF